MVDILPVLIAEPFWVKALRIGEVLGVVVQRIDWNEDDVSRYKVERGVCLQAVGFHTESICDHCRWEHSQRLCKQNDCGMKLFAISEYCSRNILL
jgi:hypothetical protein